MRQSFVILLLLIFPYMVNAQSKLLIISGKVVDNKEKPMMGATVRLKDGKTGTATSLDGSFSMTVSSVGNYILQVSFIGYKDKFIELYVDKDKVFQVVMEEKVVVGEEIIVSATRAGKNTPVAYEMVSKEELQTRNVGQDLPVLLNLTPSVVTTSDAGAGVGYTGLRVRGSDATRVNVTINGIPVNDAESQGVWWVNMPDIASSVEDIQVQRGVGTSTNGAGAFGATINLQTDYIRREPMAELNISGGSFNTHKETFKYSTGIMNDNFEFSGRVSNIMSDGYIDRASSDLKSYMLSGAYGDSKTVVKLIAFGGREITGQAWNGIDKKTLETNRKYNSCGEIEDKNGVRYYDNEVDNYQQHHAQVHINHSFNDKLKGNLAFHYTRGFGYYEQYKQNQEFDDYDILPLKQGNIKSTDLIMRKWLDNHLLGSTFSLHYDMKDLKFTLGGGYNEYDGDHYGKLIWARYAGNSEIRHKFYDNNGYKKDFNTYLKVNYSIGKVVNLFADVQVRDVDYRIKGLDEGKQNLDFSDHLFFFQPKGGAIVHLSEIFDVYGSYARANREPNRHDYLNKKEKKPEPETLDDFELGFTLRGKSWKINANAYYMLYNNQLVLTGKINNEGSPIRENVGKSYRVGLELLGALQINEILTWQGNITYSQNKNRDFVADFNGAIKKFGDTDISFSPSVIASNNIELQMLPRTKVSLLSKYVGEQYMNNLESKASKLDSYTIHNVAISHKLKKTKAFDISFNLLLNNVLNKKYVSNGYMYGSDPYYYAQAGFNFLAGVSVKF